MGERERERESRIVAREEGETGKTARVVRLQYAIAGQSVRTPLKAPGCNLYDDKYSLDCSLLPGQCRRRATIKETT